MPTPSFIFAHQDNTRNRGQHQVLGSGAASTGSTGDTGDGTGGKMFVPLATLIKNLSRRCTIAPGAGAFCAMAIKDNSNTFISSVISISGTSTFIDNDVEGTLPAVPTGSIGSAPASQNWYNTWVSTSPFPVGDNVGYICMEYQTSVSGVSLYATGTDFGGQNFGATQQYTPVAGPYLNSNFSRSIAQVPWPVSGTLQYVALVWKGIGAGTTVELAIEKNAVLGSGGDVMGPYTLTSLVPGNLWQSIVDTTTTVPITAGEYINWRVTRTAGAGASFNCVMVMGFHT